MDETFSSSSAGNTPEVTDVAPDVESMLILHLAAPLRLWIGEDLTSANWTLSMRMWSVILSQAPTTSMAMSPSHAKARVL